MAIITKQQDISVHIDPVSFTTDIEILSGNIAQTYNNDTKEYEPDRAAVPCLLMPYVVVSDPEGMMNGKQAITSAEWYEGVPKLDGTNKISTGKDYIISDEGTPKFSLKIKKNIEPNNPMQIFCSFSITDTRTNSEMRFERSVNLYTTIYDIKNYAIRTDQPKSMTIDPLKEKADENGKWLHTITAQLYDGLKAVAEKNAAYWWQINENNQGWREINADELGIYISGKGSDGNWTNKLTFDARFIRNTAFRCMARYYQGQRPTNAQSALSVTTSVNVQMPKTLDVSIRQLSGGKINAKMTTRVSFECVLRYNRDSIGTDKDNLFSITWKAHSGRPGVADKVISSGRKVSFIPLSLGFDKNYPMSIYAEVKLYAVTALVTSGGKTMTSNNKAIVAAKYE